MNPDYQMFYDAGLSDEDINFIMSLPPRDRDEMISNVVESQGMQEGQAQEAEAAKAEQSSNTNASIGSAGALATMYGINNYDKIGAYLSKLKGGADAVKTGVDAANTGSSVLQGADAANSAGSAFQGGSQLANTPSFATPSFQIGAQGAEQGANIGSSSSNLAQAGPGAMQYAGAAAGVYSLGKMTHDQFGGTQRRNIRKTGRKTLQGAAAGAAIGSLGGPIGTAIGAGLGAVYGGVTSLANVGKGVDQIERDVVRADLMGAGILDKDYNIDLGNRKIQMGKDGGPRPDTGGRRAFEIDLGNKDNGALVGKLQGLGDFTAFQSGKKRKQGEDATGYYVNGLQGGSAQDIQNLYGKFGIKDQASYNNAINQMEQGGFIDKPRGDAMRNAGVFGASPAAPGATNQGSPGMRPKNNQGSPGMRPKKEVQQKAEGSRQDYYKEMQGVRQIPNQGGYQEVVADIRDRYNVNPNPADLKAKGPLGSQRQAKKPVSRLAPKPQAMPMPQTANDPGRIPNSQSRVGQLSIDAMEKMTGQKVNPGDFQNGPLIGNPGQGGAYNDALKGLTEEQKKRLRMTNPTFY